MTKTPESFPPNEPPVPRSLPEAISIAETAVDDVDRLDWEIDGGVEPWAVYLPGTGLAPTSLVELDDLLNINGNFHVRVHPSVLVSDQGIVWVFAHELHETAALEEAFAKCGFRMLAHVLGSLITPPHGTLHILACVSASDLTSKWAAETKH